MKDIIEIGSIRLGLGGIDYHGCLIQAASYRLSVGLDGRLREVQAMDADGYCVARIDAPRRTTIARTREIVAAFNAMFAAS